MEDVKEERRNFLPVSELGISAPGEFACSWQSKWVGITAMKIEKKKPQTFPTPSKSHFLEMSQILRNCWHFMCTLMVFTVWFSTWGNWRSSGTSENGVTYCFFWWAGGKRFRQDINSYAEKTDSDTLNITFFLVCTYWWTWDGHQRQLSGR